MDAVEQSSLRIFKRNRSKPGTGVFSTTLEPPRQSVTGGADEADMDCSSGSSPSPSTSADFEISRDKLKELKEADKLMEDDGRCEVTSSEESVSGGR